MSPEIPAAIPVNLKDKLAIEKGLLDVHVIDRVDLGYFETAAKLTSIGLRVRAQPGQVFLKRGEIAYTLDDTSGPIITQSNVYHSKLSEPVLDNQVAVSIEIAQDPTKKIAQLRFWQYIKDLLETK